MKRSTFAAAAGFGAVIALGVVGFGCSSTSPAGGTGGATGTGGNAATGTGGHLAGTGGAIDAGPALPMCSPSPADQSACDSNATCVKNCGVNISALSATRALKTCTCSGPAPGGTWSCPGTAGACIYPADIDHTCFALTPTPPACPRDTADGGADGGGADGGSGSLIRSGVSTCTPPPSEVCGNICGSATAGVSSYQDSTGAGKVGYCVCISGLWQCASTAEWPAQ